MNLRRNLVTKEGPPDDGPVTDVMNVKVGKNNAGNYTGIPGVYPAYHMSHTDWVSILLDGSVPDETVMGLIDGSRNFAVAKTSRKRT